MCQFPVATDDSFGEQALDRSPRSAFCRAYGRFGQLRSQGACKPSLPCSAYAYRRGRFVSSSRPSRHLANQLEGFDDPQYPDPGIGAEPQQIAISGDDKARAGGPGAFKHAVFVGIDVNDVEPLTSMDAYGAARK